MPGHGSIGTSVDQSRVASPASLSLADISACDAVRYESGVGIGSSTATPAEHAPLNYDEPASSITSVNSPLSSAPYVVASMV